MNNLDKFNHTVGVLVKSWEAGTLQKGQYCSCAVGNLIADACGYKIIVDGAITTWEDSREEHVEHEWDNVFCTRFGEQEKRPDMYEDEAKRQIDSTGYSWQELAQLEYAFETASKKDEGKWASYKGALALIDVLVSIHGIDLTTTEEAKALFVKA